MAWSRIFEEKKPTSVYHSEDWFDKYLNQKDVEESTKRVYRGYRDRFVDWLDENEVTVPTKEDCEKFLIAKKEDTNKKQAMQRYHLFHDYISWLVSQGVMEDNLWDKMNLEELGLRVPEKRVHKSNKAKKKVKERREVFTLSDVAELLLAIEDEDDDAIVKILDRAYSKK